MTAYFVVGSRQYVTVKSFCIELSKKMGVYLQGGVEQARKFDLLVSYKTVGPDLFDIAALEEWFRTYGSGPAFPRRAEGWKSGAGNLGYYEVDKELQTSWRKKAEAELNQLVGHLF